MALACAALASGGCARSALQVKGAPAASATIAAFDGEATTARLGGMRLRPGVCAGVDTRPSFDTLDADAFVQFLARRGLDARVERARADLVYVDVANAGTGAPLRFRVAILPTTGAAGQELHDALLQHGEGSWGVHRANLAVLGPSAPLEDVIAFNALYKLPCWGVLTAAGRDDTFVIPGGYAEL